MSALAATALLAAALLAPPQVEASAAAAAHCRYLQGVARAEQALFYSPELFASGGLVPAAGSALGTGTVDLAPRIVAGVQVDASRIRKGLAAGHLADASCDLAEAEEALARFELSGDALVEGPALAAKAAVIADALPEAAAIVERTRAAMERRTATLEELQAAELRSSRLRAAAADAARAQAELRQVPAEDLGSLGRQLEARAAAELDVHRAQGESRAATALSLSLRAGVDRVLDDSAPERIPAFGLVTLTWVPGGLWQSAAEEDAARGLAAWSRSTASGSADRMRVRLEALRARAAVERTRLDEARVLLADLERRHVELGQLEGDHVRAFRDALFFELVAARSEVVGLAAGLAALDGFLGDAALKP